eukprot:358210-Chlamydomonas_euryale.AAC.4
MLRRRCLNLCCWDQFIVASQLENVPKSGATAGAFLVAPPDCAVRLPQPTLLMSNEKPVAPSDPHPFTIRVPTTEGSVNGPSTPARTCHVVCV